MTLRFFLPFDNFTIHTSLTSAEVKSRLAACTGPKKNFQFSLSGSKHQNLYAGEINDTSFTISRNINYRNSFLPVIKGEIESYLGKTEITIRMRPAIAVLIFMSIWLGVVGLVCLVALIALILHFSEVIHHGFSPAALIPFGMFTLGSALVSFGYRMEADQSKNFLKALLKDEQ